MVRSRTAVVAWLVAFGAMIGAGGSAQASKLVTFDDIGVGGEMPIYSGYAGLNWQDVEVMNLDWWQRDGNPTNGYVHGLTSGSQVAWVPVYGPGDTTTAAFSSSTPFALTSAELTSAWNDNLTVRVDGYLKGQLVDSQTFVLNPNAPTLANLGFDEVDTVRLTASGGTLDPAFGPITSYHPAPNFVIDDLRLDDVASSGGSQPTGSTEPAPVPEPSALAIAGLLVAGWWLRWRRPAA